MQFNKQTEELINLHLWEGAVQKQFDLEHLFRVETDRTISFEVVFTAFLATIVLGSPQTGTLFDQILPWVAGGLLLTTLVRRMALDNVFVDEDYIIRWTMTAIYTLTCIAILYLVLGLGRILTDFFQLNIYLWAGILLFVIAYGTLTFYEIFYQDFLFWGAVRFYNEALDESSDLSRVLRIAWLMASRLCLKLSFNEYDEDHYAIRRINKIDLTDARRAGRIGLGVIAGFMLFVILVLLVLFALPLLWVLEIKLVSAMVLGGSLVISFFTIMGIVEFVYGRYGSADIGDPTGGISNVKVILLMYFVVLLHGGLIERVIEFF